MRLIDADLLIADILEARRSETETVPKLIRFINKQPTIEPKRGRWIEYETEGLKGGGLTFCSCCGTGCTWGAFREVNRFNYCPNCGAIMEGE